MSQDRGITIIFSCHFQGSVVVEKNTKHYTFYKFENLQDDRFVGVVQNSHHFHERTQHNMQGSGKEGSRAAVHIRF